MATSPIVNKYLFNNTISFVFQTRLSPSSIAAVREVIMIIQDVPKRREQLLGNVQYVCLSIEEFSFIVRQGNIPIISLLIGDIHKSMQFSEKLMDGGVFVPVIRPRTVPKGSS